LPRPRPHAREPRRADERHHDAYRLQPRPRSRGDEAVPRDFAERDRSVPRVRTPPWTGDPPRGNPRGLRARKGNQSRVPDSLAPEVRRAFPDGLRGTAVPAPGGPRLARAGPAD